MVTHLGSLKKSTSIWVSTSFKDSLRALFFTSFSFFQIKKDEKTFEFKKKKNENSQNTQKVCVCVCERVRERERENFFLDNLKTINGTN